MQLQAVGRTRTATPKNLEDINTDPQIREQLFATFMGAYFPTQSEGDSQVDSWRYLISSFHVLPNKTLMLQRALSAISCAYVGRLNDDDRLSHHGIQLYNSSMRSMSKMLCTRTHTEDALYATVIFQMIEVSRIWNRQCTALFAVKLYCPSKPESVVLTISSQKCIAIKKTTGQSNAYDCANGFDPWVFHMQAMNTLLKENQPDVATNPLMNSIANSHAKLTIVCSPFLSCSSCSNYSRV